MALNAPVEVNPRRRSSAYRRTSKMPSMTSQFTGTDSSVDMEAKDKAELMAQPTKPTGVLSFHLKHCRLLDMNLMHIFGQPEACFYIRIVINDKVKCSCVSDELSPPATLHLDDLRQLSVKVSNKRADESNLVHIQLMGYDTPEKHRIIAGIELHLYDLIGSLYHVVTYELKRRQKTVAELDLEICFTYGLLGYGFSSQLENQQKEPGEQIAHSLFFRAEPPEERLRDELSRDVMSAVHVGHPAFIDFTHKVDIGSTAKEFGQDISKHNLFICEEPIMLLTRIRKRMHRQLEEYSEISTRIGRIDYLKDLVCNSSLAKKELEVLKPPKHLHLKHRTARKMGSVSEENLSKREAFKVLENAPGITSRLMRTVQMLKDHRDALWHSSPPVSTTSLDQGVETIQPTLWSSPEDKDEGDMPSLWARLGKSSVAAAEAGIPRGHVPGGSQKREEGDNLPRQTTSQHGGISGRRRSSLAKAATAIADMLAAGARRATTIGNHILGYNEEDETDEIADDNGTTGLTASTSHHHHGPPKPFRVPRLAVMPPTPEVSDDEEDIE